MATIAPRAELGFALATRLIADRGRRLTRRHLMALFWPEATEAKAAHSLSEALHRLRARGLPIEGDASQALWIERDAATIDVERITESRPSELVACDFTVLPGFEPRGAPALRDWVDEFRHALTLQTVRNLAIPIARAEEEHDWPTVLALAEHALRLDAADPTALRARATAAARLSQARVSAGPPRPPTTPPPVTRRSVHEPTPSACELRPSSAAAQLGTFVGREAELAVLRDAWESAKRGRGKRVLVHGASGIGKTRLVRHFRTFVRQAGGVVAEVQADPADVGRPLSAFLRLVPRLRALPGAAAIAPDLRPYLDRLTEIDAASAQWPDAADTPYILSCIERAIDELVDSVADEQPLVIVVDNAQWTDIESRRLLDALSMAISARSALVIEISCETEDPTGRDACSPTIPVRVGALPDEAARALVVDRIGRAGRVADAALMDWLVCAGEGNPLRLEEIVAHWVGGGAPFELPPSLGAVLASRIAALSSDDRRVLQTVALLGQQATLDRVERIAALDRVDLLASLDALGSNGFIEVDDAASAAACAGAGQRVRCRHGAIAEAAIAELSAPGRAVLHRAIALELERDGSESADVLWERATHWTGGNQPTDAVRTTVGCARHLAAVGLADAGSAACRRLLEEPLPDDARREALVALVHTLHHAWEWRDVVETARELRRFSDAGDVHDDVELCVLDARWQLQEDRKETLAASIRCASAPDAPAIHRVRAAEIAIKLATNAGSLPKLHEAFRAVSSCVSQADVPATDRLTVTMMYHAVGGSLALASECAHELIRRSVTMAEPARLRALLNAASAIARAGDHEEALAICEEVAHDAVKRRLMPIAAAACHRGANVALDAGDIPSANVWTVRFAAHAPPTNACGQRAVRLARARVAYHAGELTAAEHLLIVDGRPIWADASPAFAATSLATAIAVAVDGSRSPQGLRSLIAAALPAHRLLQGMGAHDFVTFALAAGYRALAEDARARALVDSYLKEHRREQTPIPEAFTAMLDRADAGAATTG